MDILKESRKMPEMAKMVRKREKNDRFIVLYC
jgi:hypothetical protein